MKVYNIESSPLNHQLTGQTKNFKIKLYYFQEGLSLRFHIYF